MVTPYPKYQHNVQYPLHGLVQQCDFYDLGCKVNVIGGHPGAPRLYFERGHSLEAVSIRSTDSESHIQPASNDPQLDVMLTMI